MSINSIENVTKYSTELDRMFAQKSATGFFADNALATKYTFAPQSIIFFLKSKSLSTKSGMPHLGSIQM